MQKVGSLGHCLGCRCSPTLARWPSICRSLQTSRQCLWTELYSLLYMLRDSLQFSSSSLFCLLIFHAVLDTVNAVPRNEFPASVCCKSGMLLIVSSGGPACLRKRGDPSFGVLTVATVPSRLRYSLAVQVQLRCRPSPRAVLLCFAPAQSHSITRAHPSCSSSDSWLFATCATRSRHRSRFCHLRPSVDIEKEVMSAWALVWLRASFHALTD